MYFLERGEAIVKRKLSLLLIAVMVCGAAGCDTTSAQDESTTEVVQTVTGDSTMVSAEALFEELGYDLNWESTSKTLYASKKKRVVAITAGSDIAVFNGEEVQMNSVAELDDVMSVTVASMEWFTGEEIDSDGNIVTEEETKDDSWKENKVSVDLSEISDETYTITEAGVYTLTGDYSGMIYVNTEGRVKLILNGVNITNENGPAIFFENSDKGIIESAEGTVNNLTDGSEYNVDAKGCIFSNDDIDLQGTGTINITANYKHGIASDDDIQIEEGTINITTVAGDAIHAGDGVEINSGTITIDSMEDGISGDKYVLIDDGEIDIITRGEVDESTDNDMPPMHGGGAGGQRREGGQGEATEMEEGSAPDDMGEKNEMPEGNPPSDMGEAQERPEGNEPGDMGERPQGNPQMSENGEMAEGNQPGGEMPGGNQPGGERPEGDMPAEESSTADTEESEDETTDDSVSSKGIKSDNLITINGGNISVNSTDHGIKCDNLIVINGGTINVESDISKGIKALGCIFINDGDINIDTKDEGIESKATVTINGGDVYVKSEDDGINAGGGSGAEMMGNVQDGDEHQIIINGGTVKIDSTQDGLDSNGNLYIYGGEVLVNGPSSGGDGALDSAAENVLYGGTLLAIGSSQMAECPESGSGQNILNITLDETAAAESTISIVDSSGNVLYEAVSVRQFQNIIFSSAEITEGEVYGIYINGEEVVSITAESGVTKYGSSGMSRGGGDRGGERGGNRGGMGGMNGSDGMAERGSTPTGEQSAE